MDFRDPRNRRVIFSILAFREARKAKRAATAAGRSVKLQTVVIELTEISQKLDRVQPDVTYSEARDLLSEVARRFHRAVSPFARETKLAGAIDLALQALQAAQTALKSVRPTDLTKEEDESALSAVYFAIEENFATINNLVADLIGLFERQTFDFGDQNARA